MQKEPGVCVRACEQWASRDSSRGNSPHQQQLKLCNSFSISIVFSLSLSLTHSFMLSVRWHRRRCRPNNSKRARKRKEEKKDLA